MSKYTNDLYSYVKNREQFYKLIENMSWWEFRKIKKNIKKTLPKYSDEGEKVYWEIKRWWKKPKYNIFTGKKEIGKSIEFVSIKGYIKTVSFNIYLFKFFRKQLFSFNLSFGELQIYGNITYKMFLNKNNKFEYLR